MVEHFLGEIFRGFEEITRFHQVRETEREYGVNNTETTQKSLFLKHNLISGIEMN